MSRLKWRDQKRVALMKKSNWHQKPFLYPRWSTNKHIRDTLCSFNSNISPKFNCRKYMTAVRISSILHKAIKRIQARKDVVGTKRWLWKILINRRKKFAFKTANKTWETQSHSIKTMALFTFSFTEIRMNSIRRKKHEGRITMAGVEIFMKVFKILRMIVVVMTAKI